MIIKVNANARADGVFLCGGVLCVKVSVPPEGGKANKRAAEVLQKAFGCKVTIVSGQRSRQKEIRLSGDETQIAAKMRQLQERCKK